VQVLMRRGYHKGFLLSVNTFGFLKCCSTAQLQIARVQQLFARACGATRDVRTITTSVLEHVDGAYVSRCDVSAPCGASSREYFENCQV
jgi:hypothetical protein